MMYHFFRRIDALREFCFYVATQAALTSEELSVLTWLLAETFEPERFREKSFLEEAEVNEDRVFEVGPRLSFATPFSTNAVAICHACGLTKVTRVERSRRQGRQPLPFDRMTEMIYQPTPLRSFGVDTIPEPVRIVPVLEEGPDALRKINRELGLGMDETDIMLYYDLFANRMGRNPTDVECFQLGQANSEHSRHWVFRGRIVIDGVTMKETLFDIVKSTLAAHPEGSVIAFSDNSSAIRGWTTVSLTPVAPGKFSPFSTAPVVYDILFTAETHNFPSGVAPRPGAETGTGGRIRDVEATGRGGLVVAGTAGYCVGGLHFPNGYRIPGDDDTFPFPDNLARPIDILIEASNGASDYGNQFGEPVAVGFCRHFDMKVYGGTERRAWLKPIMFTGGIGLVRDEHTKKGEPKTGLVIVQVGGPAYRIGMGGGAASSMIQGVNKAELDWDAVQRGDAEMGRKGDRVVRACVEMGPRNPIVIAHDQGAGGPCNVLTELVHPAGGRIEIREIRCGDTTLAVIVIWGGEYQERNAFLIYPDRLEEFQAICARERVNCEVLGKITGDGRIVLHDSRDDSTPVDLDLGQILGDLPQKEYRSERPKRELSPLHLPNLPLAELFERVLNLPSVGSKGFLVRKVDRCVTGLVRQQQCCGPRQLPVSDVAVIAGNALQDTPPGAATAIGEQPTKMLVDIRAGARMAVGEAITNLAAAVIRGGLETVRCSANEMWAAKLDGEIACLYDAVDAMRNIMIELGIAVDGGKDSLSMAAKVGGEIVKAPGQLVVSLYGAMENVWQVATPDLKSPGNTLLFVDLGLGKDRLGGSALAQVFGQIGDESPDVDDPKLLRDAFRAAQELIARGFAVSYHDRSDGGLITTLAEMMMAGGYGADIRVPQGVNPVPYFLSEELGMVIECPQDQLREVGRILAEHGVVFVSMIGHTTEEEHFTIRQDSATLLSLPISTILPWWERTSDELERLQMNPDCAEEQARGHAERQAPVYNLSFQPEKTPEAVLARTEKPKVAVIREEGSNGDREMAAAAYLGGFEPWDVTMTDLLGSEDLDRFRGTLFVGGFTFKDVFDSAKGWAGAIRFNPRLRKMFRRFYERPDTFSLGVCNGCQLMAILGLVPWLGLEDVLQPRFIRNKSERFESRWATVRIEPSPAIMLRGMEGSVLGVPVAHGEGRLHCSEPRIIAKLQLEHLAPMVFVDADGVPTERYPENPNGSPQGITALCDPTGRHLAMMPHPERAFQLWQLHYLPGAWKTQLTASPWLRMFQNAREWCEKNP